MAKSIQTTDPKAQGGASQVGGGCSSPNPEQRTRDRTTRTSRGGYGSRVKGVTGGCANHRKPRRPRRTPLVLAGLVCLVLVLMPTYAAPAYAQE